MYKNKCLSVLLISGAAIALASCGGGTDTPVKSSPTETVTVAEPEASVVDKVSAEEAMLKRGRIVWFKCRSCHETSLEGPHKVGPNIYGLMGTQAGAKEGFVFSKALKDSGIVWDDETLDAFLEKPASYVKGTKMAFVGIKKESDRKAVIAYIKENTKPAE